MNIDTLSPQFPPAAIPARSVHTPPEQASDRPVERPHHDEAVDNDQKRSSAASSVSESEAAESDAAARPEAQAQPAPVGSLLDVMV